MERRTRDLIGIIFCLDMPLINSGIIDKCSLTNEQRELRKLLRISYFFFFFLFSILLSLSAMLVESQSQEWIESSVKKGKWRTVFNLRNITTNSCSRNLGSLAHQCHRQVLSIKFLLPVLNRWSYYFSSQRDQIFFFFFFFFSFFFFFFFFKESAGIN